MRVEARLAHASFWWGPVHDFYVVFWRQPRLSEADLAAAGAAQDQIMWASSEYCVSEAEDVHEVIAWADEEAQRRHSMYALYAVASIGVETGLVWLAGVDPTRALRGPNFGRRHPADVDPVNGTPAEVYRPDESAQ